ncbi:MAG: peptidoglycan-binding protein [Acidimicrobiales bacterium]
MATLQRRLGALGFDAGRVDGIFGPDTERALVEFQRNAGLVVDGICGPAAGMALRRLCERTDTSEPVALVRERERLRQGPHTLVGRTVVIGESGGGAALAHAVLRALTLGGAHALVVSHPDPSEHAAQANAVSADAFVGLVVCPEEQCSVAYYGRPDWESWAGRRLAALLEADLPLPLGGPTAMVRGMTLPALRETRMPAVLCELGPARTVVERGSEIAAAIAGALSRWVAEANTD